ncbi:DUF4250 domain-containing protein, partial [Clostridium perfringens]
LGIEKILLDKDLKTVDTIYNRENNQFVAE